MQYKRILIKISGEALGDETKKGIDKEKLFRVADQIEQLVDAGVQCAIVVGGGNFWRGRYGFEFMERTASDYMGMIATSINALALQGILEDRGRQVRVQTAIEMRAAAEPYIRRRAVRHLEKGRIVIFACGTGNPCFTTDTAAALRAIETDCDALLLAKNVDGVYDMDPRKEANAKKYDQLTYLQVINDKLQVMDLTAITLCMDNELPIHVFALNEENSIARVAKGEKLGTIIH